MLVHTTKGYRGVVCGWDVACCESPEWQAAAGVDRLSHGCAAAAARGRHPPLRGRRRLLPATHAAPQDSCALPPQPPPPSRRRRCRPFCSASQVFYHVLVDVRDWPEDPEQARKGWEGGGCGAGARPPLPSAILPCGHAAACPACPPAPSSPPPPSPPARIRPPPQPPVAYVAEELLCAGSHCSFASTACPLADHVFEHPFSYLVGCPEAWWVAPRLGGLARAPPLRVLGGTPRGGVPVQGGIPVQGGTPPRGARLRPLAPLAPLAAHAAVPGHRRPGQPAALPPPEGQVLRPARRCVQRRGGRLGGGRGGWRRRRRRRQRPRRPAHAARHRYAVARVNDRLASRAGCRPSKPLPPPIPVFSALRTRALYH